ncbi:MAG: phytoene desaturase family protein [Chthoniobacterales bacterium]
MNTNRYDAVVVGSGPNGLAAGIRLAQSGQRVIILEGSDIVGGGARSAELTLPGFIHDVCSAIHPLGIGSPFFRTLPLEEHGLDWIQPEFALAHPLDDGTAAILMRSVAATAEGLGPDRNAYHSFMEPLLNDWPRLAGELLGPMLHVPRHPIALARFGWRAMGPATSVARRWFKDDPAKALFAGLSAHSFLSLDQIPSSAFGIILGLLGHAVGWPLPRGGSGMLSQALAEHFRRLGGEIVVNHPVSNLTDLPAAPKILLDVTPAQLIRIAADRMPAGYKKRLQHYRYGPGVFKIDYALDAPIPWRAAECGRAGTVHLGGTLEEIAFAEKQVTRGEHPDKPFVLLAQPTLFDPSRAPEGKHIAWAYVHVPNGSTVDMTAALERQIERFAPGFQQCVLARHTIGCAELERRNPNLVGGDINGGSADLFQLIARPTFSFCPYRTAMKGIYLCSSSTPPGGGVHGMCGFHAANAALGDR